MDHLTTALLAKACRIFLALAYADGEVPESKKLYREIRDHQPLESLLKPPVCQPVPDPEGGTRGYALRLGCSHFPHMKLQVIDCGAGTCVFGVDTHDAMAIDPSHPDAGRWLQLQSANRCLKQRIERAWEEAGLLTFNALLRDELAAGRG